MGPVGAPTYTSIILNSFQFPPKPDNPKINLQSSSKDTNPFSHQQSKIPHHHHHPLQLEPRANGVPIAHASRSGRTVRLDCFQDFFLSGVWHICTTYQTKDDIILSRFHTHNESWNPVDKASAACESLSKSVRAWQFLTYINHFWS